MGREHLPESWLGKNKIGDYLVETPDHLYDVSTRAYFGGRIDCLGYGVVDPVYHYDIVVHTLALSLISLA